jgi:hypothetical protein
MGTLDAFFYFCRYKCVSPVMLMLVRFLNLLDFRECNWWRFRCFELLVSSLPFPFPVVFMLLQIAMHLFTYWFSNLKRIVKAPQLSSDLCKQAVYRKSCCRVCMRLQVFLKELMQYWRGLWRKERVKDHWTWCDRHSAINLVVSRIILHQPQNWRICS